MRQSSGSAQDRPVSIDGDGKTDPGSFDPQSSTWRFRPSGGRCPSTTALVTNPGTEPICSRQWSLPGDVIAARQD